jgi:hypothetical protein
MFPLVIIHSTLAGTANRPTGRSHEGQIALS